MINENPRKTKYKNESDIRLFAEMLKSEAANLLFPSVPTPFRGPNILGSGGTVFG
jgi:hypothetical protein